MWATLDSHHFTPTHLQRDGSRSSRGSQPTSCGVFRVVAVAQGQRAKRPDLGATEAPLLQSRIGRITRRLLPFH